ncbi:MAG: trigger factor [Clostridiales bacterium]
MMNSQAKQGEKHQIILEVEIPVAEMQTSIQKAGRKIAAKVNIPGFRKGKAPQSVLESFIGVEAILEEASQELVSAAYYDAVQANNLEPVAQPQLEITQLVKDQPLLFTAIVTVKPEVTLGDYKGLALIEKVYNITDADVETELEKTRQRVAKVQDAPEDAAVENGDTVNIDFKGFVDDVAFEGGAAEAYSLEVGSKSFIPGFEDQIIGMKINEEKDITVSFPEEYHEKSLAGKEAIFKVKLHSIQRKILPELNDDFAKEISETSDTIEQLRAETKTKMQENFDKNAKDACRALGVQTAVENAEVDIPAIMIENRIDDILEDLNQKLESQNLKMEMYLKYAKCTMEEMRERYRVQAESAVKMDLVMETIGKDAAVEVSEEDIDKQMEMMSASYWQPKEQIRQIMESSGNMANVIEGIRMVKAGQLIYDNAVVSFEEVKDEVPAQEENQEAE